jgi:hypothetical protein
MENVMSHKITKAATAQIDESVQTDAAPAQPQPPTTPDGSTTGNAPAVVGADATTTQPQPIPVAQTQKGTQVPTNGTSANAEVPVNSQALASRPPVVPLPANEALTFLGVKPDIKVETTGIFVAGAPFTGPVDFIGELVFSVNASGEGVISGHVAGSEDGTILTFAEEPVTGSYRVGTDCRGTATITPEGQPEMHFSFVVVDCGKEMLAFETDADTVVSGTLVKGD